MNKETISPTQAVCMLIIFIIGSATLFVMGLEAEMDIWLAIIIGIVASALILCMYARILSIFPESDFFETLEILLGRPITIVVVILLTWFAFDLGSVVLTNYDQFVSTVGLTETPKTIISLSILLVCAISVKKGTEVLARWARIVIFIIMGFALMIIPLMIGEADFNNIRPVLYNGLNPVLKGALGMITFPLAETVIFLLLFPAFKKGTSKYKIFLKGLIIGGVTLLIISTLNVMVLSAPYAKTVVYPTYLVLSIVRVSTFINRLEVIAAAIFCLAVFFKISMLLLATCRGVSYIFKANNYRTLVFPIALLMMSFHTFSFENVIQQQDWAFEVWPYYASIFIIIIPFIVFALVEIRYRVLRNKGQLVLQDDDKNSDELGND